MRKRILILILAATGLAGCAGYERDITLRNLQAPGNGPDEFSILPGKPLEQPKSFTELPAPTPGATNLTDRNPKADGIAALGGRPERLTPQGVPGSDGALVRHASRNGVDPTVRETLAAQDEDFRRRQSRFTKLRIARQDLYNKVYKRETLNARREMNRYRRSTGVRTPSAPPPN
ncbi:DUF3035 domain-containing protein [Rhodobacteraceae bacterium LMO-12]|jgi:hypothetical protein|nr:DUF3035 domain-containing protein [Rhodobacteraceae bacterium LMO-JJ12]